MQSACSHCGFITGQPVLCLGRQGLVMQVTKWSGMKGCGHIVQFSDGRDPRSIPLPDAGVTSAPCADHPRFEANCIACNRQLASSRILSRDAQGRLLYALTIERFKMHDGRLQWCPDGFEYTHARDAEDARQAYLKTRPMGVRILAIAPVIGYNVLDSHGEKLLV